MSSQTLRRVLISDAVDPKCVTILQENNISVDYKPKLPLKDLLQEIKNYDGLIVRSATKVTQQVIEAGTSLKIIGRAGTGVDNIDSVAATKHGVIVMNTPGGNTLSAAEHTCAMILSASRQIPQGYASLQKEKWERSTFMGNEVYGKTLAILGLGRIGREVATRMQAFGMKTIGYDPLVPPEACKEFGVTGLSLEEIWPQADYITVHVPLIPETKDLIGDETLRKCKKGVYIVNVARGGVVDEDALLRSLLAGHAGGAALDVFSQEPLKDFQLVHHPKVVATPHLGANTHEAQSRVAEEIAEQFVDFARGKRLIGVVNAPLLNEALEPENAPWVATSQALGKLVAALTCSGSAKSCQISVVAHGSELAKSEKVLRSAALVGAVQSYTKNPNVNIINIQGLAEQAGVQVKALTSGPSSCCSQAVRVRADRDSSSYTAVGCVQGQEPVLCELQESEFSTKVPLRGHVVVYKAADISKDLPAVLGSILTKPGLSINATYQSHGLHSYIFVNVTAKDDKPAFESVGNAQFLADITF